MQEYDPPRLKNRKQYISDNAAPMVRMRLLPYPLASQIVVQVKKVHVISYRDALRKKYKPSTVNPSEYDHPWHAMRHTFITMLAEANASPEAISRIVGHAGAGNRITSGYTHVSVDYLSREIEKLRLLSGPPATVLRLADYRQHA